MIDIFGLKLHGYGLLIGLGVLVAWEVAQRYGKIKEEVIDKLVVGLVLSGIAGARMYHVIDFWEYYSKDLIKIFYVWNGGLGIWGGIIGGFIYIIYFAKKNNTNIWNISDSVTLGLPLAQAIGRVGNFVNGELYGKNGEPLFAWEGGLNIFLFIILFVLNKKTYNKGLVTGFYLIGYGVIRILLENFRPNEIIWRIGGVPTAIWMSFFSIAVGVKLIYDRK